MRQILFIEVQEARDLLGKTSGEELFLLGRERTDRVDLLHTRGLCVAHHKTHKGKISQTLLDLDTILDTTSVRNEGGGKMTTEKRLTHAQLDVAREVLDPLVLVQRALDESRGDDALFAVHTSDDRVGEQGSGCEAREASRV